MTRENYVSRKAALLKDFYGAIALITPALNARLGEESAAALVREAGKEYEALIPQIPYIGESSLGLIFYFPTTQYLAVYRTLQRQGWTIEDVGQVIFEISTARLRALPGFVHRTMGYLWFSPWFKTRSRKMAAKSQLRKYPGAAVVEFIEGNGQDFDYGIDYVECSTCKFLAAQGAMEMAPYICAVDKPASELLGWGLSRTKTLAEGGERCDFRFKKGGKTFVTVPPSYRPMDQGNAA